MTRGIRILLCALAAVSALAGCTGFGPPAGEKWGQFLHGDRPAQSAAGILSPDANVRRWSIIALARHGDPKAADAIMILTEPGAEAVPLVRSTAIVALRILGDKRALPSLAAACADPEPFVRADAARALGDLGGPEQIAPLSKLRREDFDPAVRLEAVYAIRNIGGPAALPPLIAALNDPDESVVFAAHAALRTQTGQDLPPDPKQWQSWLDRALPPAKL